MNNTIGENIVRLRRDAGMTQKKLAEQLGISFQTVSKWERGLCCPDLMLLPRLADLFGVSVDNLLGHVAGESRTHYTELYKNDDYYWGTEPTPFCYQVIEKYPPVRHLKLLEIGCGEGRDAVFFARNGYDTAAFDIEEKGVEKAKLLAAKFNVPLTAFRADMLTYTPTCLYDVIYASRTLIYLPDDRREDFFAHYKKYTRPGGIHAFMTHVTKPSVKEAPDADHPEYFMKSGELFTYYTDWDFLLFDEQIIDCNSSGIPHKHCMDFMIAVKPLD